MKKVINNRFFQGLFLLLLIGALAFILINRDHDTAKLSNSIQDAINELVRDPDLEHATVSFLVTESGTGNAVAAMNPELSTVRASAQKLFATSMAIEILGKDYRPETRLYADGDMINGVLDGDLWIRGGGDVSLGSKYFNEPGEEDTFLHAWAKTIKDQGISAITGRIIADGSEFGYAGAPDGWSWFDLGNYYGAGPSGICLYDNALRYIFRTSNTAGDAAEYLYTIPDVPELIFQNSVNSEQVRTTNVAFYGAPYSYDRFAVGSIPLSNEYNVALGSMPDPEWRMAVDFLRVLETNGIRVLGGPHAVRKHKLAADLPYDKSARLIHAHPGPTTEELVKVTNQESVNLFAEQLICQIGYKLDGEGTTYAGLKRIRDYLAERIDTKGLHLVDGSGMSRGNAVNAQHFCDMLNYMYRSDNHETFHNTLAVAGLSGTLKGVCKGAAGEGRVFAKTGTMTRAKSFVGYVHSKSGKKLTFAFTIVNFDCGKRQVAKKMVEILNIMAEF